MAQSRSPETNSGPVSRWREIAKDPEQLSQAFRNISTADLVAWKKSNYSFYGFIVGLAGEKGLLGLLPLKQKHRRKKLA